MKALHLTLKKKWFDMIASGFKTEEYRDINKYFKARLVGREYDVVCFKNGYRRDSPTITLEYKGFFIGIGIIEWGALPRKEYYVIKLGKMV